MPKTVDANIGGRLTIEVGGAMSPVSSMSSPQRERAPLLEEPTIEDDEEERKKSLPRFKAVVKSLARRSMTSKGLLNF